MVRQQLTETSQLNRQAKGIAHMSAQAVGQAVGRNKISIIIPCHRVIGKNGTLTGYAGGLDKKQLCYPLKKLFDISAHNFLNYFFPIRDTNVLRLLVLICLAGNKSVEIPFTEAASQ